MDASSQDLTDNSVAPPIVTGQLNVLTMADVMPMLAHLTQLVHTVVHQRGNPPPAGYDSESSSPDVSRFRDKAYRNNLASATGVLQKYVIRKDEKVCVYVAHVRVSVSGGHT
jgi:hypothetical protein